jgi:hypothetical protein
MDSIPEIDKEPSASELKAAGYTSSRTTALLCLGVGAIGGALGSVYLAIMLNALLGPEMETFNKIAGAAAGAFTAAGILLVKIRQGNIDAREKIQDAEWRKLLHTLHRRPGLDLRKDRPGGP